MLYGSADFSTIALGMTSRSKNKKIMSRRTLFASGFATMPKNGRLQCGGCLGSARSRGRAVGTECRPYRGVRCTRSARSAAPPRRPLYAVGTECRPYQGVRCTRTARSAAPTKASVVRGRHGAPPLPRRPLCADGTECRPYQGVRCARTARSAAPTDGFAW